MNHILHTCSLYAWIQIGVTLHNEIKKAQECGMGGKVNVCVYFSCFLLKKPSMHQFTLWFFMHIVNTEKNQ